MDYPTFHRDHFADIETYEDAVLNGTRRANRFEILAVQRHVNDLARIEDPDFPFWFNVDKALHAIRFIESLPHIKGRWARGTGPDRLIKLEGWQKWIVASIFGWVRKDNGLRRYRSAQVFVPRKNGKSTLAAAIGLYMHVADGEYSAEVYCGATSEAQAWEVFRPARQMALQQPKLRAYYRIKVHAKWLECERDQGSFKPLIGDPGDGASPSCYICDEYHEHDNDNQRDTMVTGMAARSQPLEFIISTSGSSAGGPCHLQFKECERLLAGVTHQDDLFCVIYTIDKDVDWKSELALEMANPNFGVSIVAENLRAEQLKAVASARKQNRFRTKHLNQWMGAKEAWLNAEDWVEAGDPSLHEDQFIGEACEIGLDMSETDDLTSDVKCFTRVIDGLTHYYFFGHYYTTEEKAKENEQYRDWIDAGHLIACEGNVIDQEDVEAQVIQDIETYLVERLMHDPAGAVGITQRIAKAKDIEAVKVAQSYSVFSPYMRDFEGLLKQGRIHHDGNPVLAWCFANVVAKETMDGKYIRPVKESRDNKIDGAVAALLAFIAAHRIEEDEEEFCGIV